MRPKEGQGRAHSTISHWLPQPMGSRPRGGGHSGLSGVHSRPFRGLGGKGSGSTRMPRLLQASLHQPTGAKDSGHVPCLSPALKRSPRPCDMTTPASASCPAAPSKPLPISRLGHITGWGALPHQTGQQPRAQGGELAQERREQAGWLDSDRQHQRPRSPTPPPASRRKWSVGAGEPVCFPFNCYICVPWTPASAAPGSRLRDLLGITSSPTPRFIPKGRETERSHSHDKVCVHSRSQGSTGLPRAPREHCRDSSRPVRSGHPRGGVCSPRPRSLVGPSAQGKRGAKNSRESGWWQGDAWHWLWDLGKSHKPALERGAGPQGHEPELCQAQLHAHCCAHHRAQPQAQPRAHRRAEWFPLPGQRPCQQGCSKGPSPGQHLPATHRVGGQSRPPLRPTLITSAANGHLHAGGLDAARG